jgi:hypothetical protein
LIERADEIRARIPVSSVVGRVVALKKRGADYFGICPFHNEKTGSFSVNDKKGFFYCFGCHEKGDVIAFIRRRQDLEFREAIELLESENGLRHLEAAKPAAPPVPKVEQAEDRQKADKVAEYWAKTRAIEAGDPVDRYLRGRLIVPPSEYGFGVASVNAGWPVSLRFAPRLWDNAEKRALIGMVAAFRPAEDGPVVAVHRTFLKVDQATGAVTKAGTQADKRMFGNVKGGAIFLAPIADKMGGGEGIETTLSAMQLYKRGGMAFGARAGMARLELPIACSDFIYWADKNKTHPDHSKSRVGEAAAYEGKKLNGVGRNISVQVPRLAAETADFNDVLFEIAKLAAAPSPIARALASQKARGIEHGAPANFVPMEST